MIRDAVFDTIYEMMKEDPDIYILTADMGAWGLDKIKEKYPDRFINVGCSEQNMISIATGLAYGGKLPICYAISAFLVHRALDQIRMMPNLPITLIGVGADMSYGTDGWSHWSFYDHDILSFFAFTVYHLTDENTASQMTENAVKARGHAYLRIEGK